jgi:hypothetical protein
LSNSSNESNGGGGGSGNGSPKVSPRSLFDRVRRRSQSDAKSQQSIDYVNSSSGSNTLPASLSVNKNGIIRKHLSHSISEENDEVLNDEHSPSPNKMNTSEIHDSGLQSSAISIPSPIKIKVSSFFQSKCLITIKKRNFYFKINSKPLLHSSSVGNYRIFFSY